MSDRRTEALFTAKCFSLYFPRRVKYLGIEKELQAAELPQLPPRVVVSVEPPWFRSPPKGFASVVVEICSDSLVAVNVINGDWAPYSANIVRLANEMQVLLHSWWKLGYVRPRTAGASWCRHVFREEKRRQTS